VEKEETLTYFLQKIKGFPGVIGNVFIFLYLFYLYVAIFLGATDGSHNP